MDKTPSVYMSDELRDVIDANEKVNDVPSMSCVFYMNRKSGDPTVTFPVDSIKQNIDADGHKWTTTQFWATRAQALDFLRNFSQIVVVEVKLGADLFMKVKVTDHIIEVISDCRSFHEIEIGFSFR